MNYDQFQSWTTTASPDELTRAGKSILSNISKLDSTHRNRFVQEVQNDPSIQRLFDSQRTNS